MWQEGTIGIPVKKEAEKEYIAVHYTLKVYDEPSKFGINHGKISKLQLKQNGKIVANYDRGWDIVTIGMMVRKNVHLPAFLNQILKNTIWKP